MATTSCRLLALTRGSTLAVVPLLALTAVAVSLAWLNQSPWWGWTIVAVSLAGLGVTAPWWLRGRAIVQTGAWVIAALIVSAAAVGAAPPLQTRMDPRQHRRLRRRPRPGDRRR